jgi:hypothetical protein
MWKRVAPKFGFYIDKYFTKVNNCQKGENSPKQNTLSSEDQAGWQSTYSNFSQK